MHCGVVGCVVVLVVVWCAGVEGLSISNLVKNRDPTPVNQKFELTFDLSQIFANPFDPSQISVSALFKGPAQPLSNINTPCFAWRNFTESGQAVGGFVWKCRMSPSQEGVWSYTVLAIADGGKARAQVSGGFKVVGGPKRGFVRISPFDSRRFVISGAAGNQSYFPIGMDLAWTTKYDHYESYVPKLAASGANWIRVWMAVWQFAIEWQDTGLGNYTNRMYNAWQLDKVFETCEENGVFIQFVQNIHGEFSETVNPNWPQNPYNSALGGPLTSPDKLWSNRESLDLFYRRFRYTIARWSYSSALMSWELWNEVDLTTNWDNAWPTAVGFIENCANYFKKVDPYRHLVTLSLSNNLLPAYPALNAFTDYLNTHDYIHIDIAVMDVEATHYMHEIQPRKPCFVAEFGIGSPDFSQYDKFDPKGLSMYNGLWAGLVSGSSGTGMFWFWNFVVDDDWYPNFVGISNFLKGEVLDQSKNYVSTGLVVSAPTAPHANLTVIPPIGWGVKAAVSNFKVSSDWSTIYPMQGNLAQYIYGVRDNSVYRAPPSFSVDTTAAWKLVINVNGVSSNGATAVVYVDGKVIVAQPLYHGQNVTVIANIPAGRHVVKVDNTGDDWYQISSYVFSGYPTSVRSWALINNHKALGWVQSVFHDWNYVYEGFVQPTLRDVKANMKLLEGESCPPPTQSIQVTWYATATGKPSLSNRATCIQSVITLAVPTIESSHADYAFKVEF